MRNSTEKLKVSLTSKLLSAKELRKLKGGKMTEEEKLAKKAHEKDMKLCDKAIKKALKETGNGDGAW